jgi:hypothetical protein
VEANEDVDIRFAERRNHGRTGVGAGEEIVDDLKIIGEHLPYRLLADGNGGRLRVRYFQVGLKPLEGVGDREGHGLSGKVLEHTRRNQGWKAGSIVIPLTLRTKAISRLPELLRRPPY